MTIRKLVFFAESNTEKKGKDKEKLEAQTSRRIIGGRRDLVLRDKVEKVRFIYFQFTELKGIR